MKRDPKGNLRRHPPHQSVRQKNYKITRLTLSKRYEGQRSPERGYYDY